MLLLLLDSNILGRMVRPEIEENKPVVSALIRLGDMGFRILVPEIIDYELRRKLLHLAFNPHQPRRWAKVALDHLEGLGAAGYVALTTETFRLAAELWADSRAQGQSRDHEDSLDVDVILAAQARQNGAYIVTSNEKHFQGMAPVFDWRPYQP